MNNMYIYKHYKHHKPKSIYFITQHSLIKCEIQKIIIVRQDFTLLR